MKRLIAIVAMVLGMYIIPANAQLVGHLVCADYTQLTGTGMVTRLASISDLAGRGYIGWNPNSRFNRPPITIAIGYSGSFNNKAWKALVRVLPYLDPINNGPWMDETRDPMNFSTIQAVKSWVPHTPDCLWMMSEIGSPWMNRVDRNGRTLELVNIDDPNIYRSPFFAMTRIGPHIYPNLTFSRNAAFRNNTPFTTLYIK